MKVHDEYIPDDLFEEFLERMPQASVEILLEDDGEILLVKRRNEPAKGEWFWPGTRLYKGETFVDAVHRLADEELGLEVDICCQLGVHNHFWETGIGGVDMTHTINIVYHVHPDNRNQAPELNDQHSDYKFVSDTNPNMHEYVVEYISQLHRKP